MPDENQPAPNRPNFFQSKTGDFAYEVLLEEPADGLKMQWFGDSRVSIFTLTSVAPETMTAWVKSVEKQQLNVGNPFYVLHDFTAIMVTDVWQKALEELAEKSQAVQGYTIYVAPKGIQAQKMRQFIWGKVLPQTPHIEAEFLYDRYPAIDKLVNIAKQGVAL